MELPPGFTAASTSSDAFSRSSADTLTPPPSAPIEATGFTFQEKWGLPVEAVYRLGLGFYRGTESCFFVSPCCAKKFLAVYFNGRLYFLDRKRRQAPLHISYKDKVRLVGYTRQISHGPYEEGRVADVGVFNVIGSDRR